MQLRRNIVIGDRARLRLTCDDGDDAGDAVATSRPYFVHVGTIEARKNLALLLTLWRRLEERLGERTPSLVLVGRYGWENEAVLDHLQRSPNLRGIVHQAANLSDEVLARLMRGARAVLAEIVENPLPKDRGRIDLHRHPYYYALRNHIVDFLNTRDGLELNRAFLRITDPKVRRSIVDLVRSLATVAGPSPPVILPHPIEQDGRRNQQHLREANAQTENCWHA